MLVEIAHNPITVRHTHARVVGKKQLFCIPTVLNADLFVARYIVECVHVLKIH